MKKNKKKLLIFLTILIFLILISIFIYNSIFDKNVQLSDSDNRNNILPNFESRIENFNNFQFDGLSPVGWLQVQGTNIDLPVFTSYFPGAEKRGEIKVDFNYGWRSVNYYTGENRLTILGHNMLNVSSKPLTDSEFLTDFEDLMKYVYYDFAKNNLYLKYTDSDGEKVYVIYSIGFYDYSEDVGTSYNSVEDLNFYIDKVRKRSIYDYNVDVDENDNIISIMTCTRFFGLNDRNQFKIDARELRENEKYFSEDVKINDNYEEVLTKLEVKVS